MTPEEFLEACRTRIPTPPEFVSTIRAREWKIVVRDDGTAAIRAERGPLSEMMARMLSREPYRTGVLDIVRESEPLEPAKPRLREWLWPGGMVVAEEPSFASFGDPDHHPGRASHWRYAGEANWMPIVRISGRSPTPTPVAIPAFDGGTPLAEWRWADGTIRKERDLFRDTEPPGSPAWFRLEGDEHWSSYADVPAAEVRGDHIPVDAGAAAAGPRDGATHRGVLPGPRGPLAVSGNLFDA